MSHTNTYIPSRLPKRVKGHGKRATYIVGSSSTNTGWHVKLRPSKEKDVLRNEARRINWARKQTKLPVTTHALSIGTPLIGLLATKTVEGSPAHHLIDSLGPNKLVKALSNGMRSIQETPTAGFPFEPPQWAVNKRPSIERIRALDSLRLSGKRLHPGFEELSEKELEKIIEQGPEKYVQRTFVHGDLCMPNMLMSQDGTFTGLIDLGALHAGDPALDIALLGWCINDNLGPKWADYFLNLHGYSSDDTTIQFYRLAYDLSLNFPDPWGWTMAPKIVQRRAELEGVKL